MGILLVAARPSFAHHSRAMFDIARNVTYRGIVKEYLWQNPHSYIVITVGADAKEPSTVGTWDIEASSISIMLSQGWTRTTYKPGDPITVVAHPKKNGSKGALLFYAIKPDGTPVVSRRTSVPFRRRIADRCRTTISEPHVESGRHRSMCIARIDSQSLPPYYAS